MENVVKDYCCNDEERCRLHLGADRAARHPRLPAALQIIGDRHALWVVLTVERVLRLGDADVPREAALLRRLAQRERHIEVSDGWKLHR